METKIWNPSEDMFYVMSIIFIAVALQMSFIQEIFYNNCDIFHVLNSSKATFKNNNSAENSYNYVLFYWG